jgi:hypothetical protein
MKTITFTLVAVSALTIATPLAAQTWQSGRTGAQSDTRGGGRAGNHDVERGQRSIVEDIDFDFGRRIDSGIARGTITRREAITLRTDLNALRRLQRTYGRDGFSRAERTTLMRRSAGLERAIDRAERNMGRGMPRAAWNDDRDKDHAEAIAVGVGPGHRGDRFSGDLRVGQHFSDRQIALPVQYRSRYQDNERSYYRYDANRVYQIDRSSGLILAMFDVSN